MYRILGKNYELDEGIYNRIKYQDIFGLQGIALSIDYEKALLENCEDMDSLMQNETDITGFFLGQAIVSTLDMLGDLKVYTYDADSFVDLMNDSGVLESWNRRKSKIEDQYVSILEEAEEEIALREYRKASRGQMVGGGFGMGNAIKGAAKAEMYNMATGAIHSVANSIGNSSTNTELKRKKKNLYEIAIPQLKDAMREVISDMMIPFSKIVTVEGVLQIKYSDSDDTSKAKALCQNICRGNIPQEEVVDYIYQVLELDPVQEDLFQFMMWEFGDENGEIRRLARDLHIFSVSSAVQKMMEDVIFEIDFADKDEIISGKDAVLQRANTVHEESDRWIEPLDEIIGLYEHAECTCDGIEYETENELENARNEMKRFIELTNNIDGNDENLLMELKGIFEDFTSGSRDKYVRFISKELEEFDTRRRTVNGNIYKTREEADKAIQSIAYIREAMNRLSKETNSLVSARDKIKESGYNTKETEKFHYYLNECISARNSFDENISEAREGTRFERVAAVYKAMADRKKMKLLQCISKNEEEDLSALETELRMVKSRTLPSLNEANKVYVVSLKNAYTYQKNVVNKASEGSFFSKIANNTKEYFSKGYEEDYKYFMEKYNGQLPEQVENELSEYNEMESKYQDKIKRIESEYKDKYSNLGKEYKIKSKNINGASIIEPDVMVSKEEICEILGEIVEGDIYDKVIFEEM